MTYPISDVTRRVVYSGSLGTGPYPFLFEILTNADIGVYKNTTLLTLSADYTVTINADGTGSVTLTSAATSTDTISIFGNKGIQRQTDFTTGGDLFANSLNDELDAQTIFAQQNSEAILRSIRAPVTDPTTIDMVLPAKADRADTVLTFDTDGNPSATSSSAFVAGLSGSILGANYVTNNATGDGSTTAFTVSVAPGSKTNIQIYIDGVYQNKASFSLSGTTVTFTEAPPLNSSIEFMIGYALQSLTGAASIDFTQAGTGAQTRTVESKLQDVVSVKDFGAVGDGVTDDTAAVQAAFDAAAHVHLVAGETYLVDNLIIPNTYNWKLSGNNATIKKSSSGDNYYLMASYKHINNIAEAQGPCDIRNVIFNADSNATNALIIQNWNSYIEVEARSATGSGVVFSAETRNNTTFPTSSLVNSKFLLKSHHNGGFGFFVQDSLRNNATDGALLSGSYIYANGDWAVYIEAGAGWDVSCNTYANGAGIYFNGHGAGTLIHDSYIDDGDGSVSALPISGSTFSYAVQGNAALSPSRFGALKITSTHLSGPVTHNGAGDSAPYALWSEGNFYHAGAYIFHSYFGATRKIFSQNDVFVEANPLRFHNSSSTGIIHFKNALLLDKDWYISGKMNALTDDNYQIHYWDKDQNGGENFNYTASPSAFSQTIEIPPMPNYAGRVAKIYIQTRANYNGGIAAEYEGTLTIQAKVNGTDSWVANLTNVTYDAADFTTGPTITVSDNGDGTGEFDLDFDLASSNGYGRCLVAWQS